MPNSNRKNEPPTGEGKKQSPYSGEENKLGKRTEEALQAQRGHEELNIGTDEEEDAARTGAPQEKKNPKRPKAGR